jgi:competence protein ComEC
MHAKTLVCALGIIAGIICGELSPFASEVGIIFLVLGLLQCGLYIWERKNNSTTRVIFLSLLTALFSLGLFVGVMREQLVQEKIKFTCENICTFEGVIVSSPQNKDAYQTFVVHPVLESVDTLGVQVRTALYPKYEIGEQVKITGKIILPKIIPPHTSEKGSSKSFDYGAYLLTKNVGSEIVYPKIETIDSDAHTMTDVLGRWKESMITRMGVFVSSPNDALASGMLFGASSMSSEFIQLFRVAGLSHIIVLSGFNIAIVIASVLFILRFLPLVLRIVLASITVIIFVVMVGAEASVIRATLMAFIGLLATLLGRPYVAKQALIISFLLIVLYEPYSLLHDVSLHLSFLATAGIIYLVPIFEKVCKSIPSDSLREMCITTLSAYVITLPYICYMFGTVSIYALLANVIALPLVPPAMLLSALVVLASYFSSTLSLAIGFLDSILLSVIRFVAEMVGYLPFSYFSITISFQMMCLLYVALAAGVVYLQRKNTDETNITKHEGILTDVISY